MIWKVLFMNVLIVKVNGSFVLYLLFADDFQVWEVLFDAVDECRVVSCLAIGHILLCVVSGGTQEAAERKDGTRSSPARWSCAAGH